MNNANTDRIEINNDSAKVVNSDVPVAKVRKVRKPKRAGSGKKMTGLIVLIIGGVTLVAGVVFLLLNLLKAPVIRDADFLVEIGAWQMEDEPTVIWDFKEVGKGSLTTNFHVNDYDFIWSMDDKTLKIETDWLYTLNDEYTYELNQGDNELILTSREETYTFVPAEYPANQNEEEKPAEE